MHAGAKKPFLVEQKRGADMKKVGVEYILVAYYYVEKKRKLVTYIW